MHGHIRKRTHRSKSGKTTTRWYVVVDLGRGLNGKRRQKWHGGYATVGDAEQARAEIVASVYDRTYVEATKVTVASWVTGDWLNALESRAKPTTVASYRANLEHHVLPALGSLKLHEVTGEHLDAFYAELLADGRIDGKGGLQRRSVGNIHMLIRLIFRDARSAGIVKRNPTADAHPPKRNERKRAVMRAWTTDELAAFLQACAGEHLQAAFHLAALTGMRRGEIAALRWPNFDPSRAQVFVAESRTRVGTEIVHSDSTKTGGARTVDLDPRTVQMLRAHRRRQQIAHVEQLAFTYPDGRQLRPDYLSERFLRVAAKAGLRRIRFHDLRHTHATIALQAGVPVHVVAQRLGHANPAMTLNIYSHVLPGQQAEAARLVANALFAPFDSARR